MIGYVSKPAYVNYKIELPTTLNKSYKPIILLKMSRREIVFMFFEGYDDCLTDDPTERHFMEREINRQNWNNKSEFLVQQGYKRCLLELNVERLEKKCERLKNQNNREFHDRDDLLRQLQQLREENQQLREENQTFRNKFNSLKNLMS